MTRTGEINKTFDPDLAPGDIRNLQDDWRQSMEASSLADGSIHDYILGPRQLTEHLIERGMPTEVANIHREHVESFLVDLRRVKKRAPNTRKLRYIGCDKFFEWCKEVGEIEENPMENIPIPEIPELPPVDPLTEEEEAALLATCKGKKFEAIRDTAILTLMFDTGLRRGEIAAMSTTDIDFDDGTITIPKAKGNKALLVQLWVKTNTALRDYRRARERYVKANPHLDCDAFWIGRQGAFSGYGIYSMFKRRARKAGVRANVYPHKVRNTTADRLLASGMSEGDVMNQFGWRNRRQLDRYTSSRAGDRARAAKRELDPDR